jgi:integrase
MRDAGFEPALLAWEAFQIDINEFQKWLMHTGDRNGKQLAKPTIDNIMIWARKFIKSKMDGEQFINQYKNSVNTRNNIRKALKYLCRYKNIREPEYLKMENIVIKELIKAPSKDEVLEFLSRIKDREVRCYLALCATQGIRSRRLLQLRWNELDLNNGWININENIRTKKYRPNPIHRDIIDVLRTLKNKDDYVFNISIYKVERNIKKTRMNIKPSNLRDFFYNEARKQGVDRDILEWLMGHSLGIKAHYLADNIKEEYAKFEEAFRLKDII